MATWNKREREEKKKMIMTKNVSENSTKNISIYEGRDCTFPHSVYLRTKTGSVFWYTLWTPRAVNSYHVVTVRFQRFGDRSVRVLM
jgi:hypothetical protein